MATRPDLDTPGIIARAARIAEALDALDDAHDGKLTARAAYEAARSHEDEAAAHARRAGATWRQIAAVLGVHEVHAARVAARSRTT